MAAKVFAPINSSMLKWAREGIGIPIAIAASKLGLDLRELQDLEAGIEKPTFPKLLKICDLYKRSPGVFFLENVPPPDAKPQDFRVLDGEAPAELSPSALLEFRRANGRRESAIELAMLLGEDVLPFVYTATVADDVEKLGKSWRENFGAKDCPWRSEYEALNFWKLSIEKLGVLVFQPTVESLSDFRGVALYHSKFPIIILNSKDSVRGRIFSLLHEFCHLLLHVSGIGDMETGQNAHSNNIEVFCNAFAGACLIPQDEVLASQEIKELIRGGANSSEVRTLEKIVKKYQASWEVVIRRVLEVGLVSPAVYRSWRAELKSYYSKLRPNAEGGFAEWINRRIAANGRSYTNLVLRASAENRITK